MQGVPGGFGQRLASPEDTVAAGDGFGTAQSDAGEAAAAEKGFKTVSVDTQAKALMEVDAGTADAAIIDLLMAGAMVGARPESSLPDP